MTTLLWDDLHDFWEDFSNLPRRGFCWRDVRLLLLYSMLPPVLLAAAWTLLTRGLFDPAYPALPAPSGPEEGHLVPWPAQLAATPDLAKTMGHPLPDGVVPELGEGVHPDP